MKVSEIFTEYNQLEKKGFDEYDIIMSINENGDKIVDEEEKKKLSYESLAFNFVENPPKRDGEDSKCFGYKFSGINEDGTSFEIPSVDNIDSDTIEYWKQRVSECQNPILKARYSGLVYTFCKTVTGEEPPFEFCREYINALITIAKNGYSKYEMPAFSKLDRAFKLSCSINDKSLIDESKNALINLVNNCDKRGSWGYCYEVLIGNKKANLSSEEEKSIIDKLEGHLSLLINDENNDPWAIQAIATMLADYYNKNNKKEDVKRVLVEIGKAFDKRIDKATALQASGWLEIVYKIYKQYGLKDESEVLLIRIHEISAKIKDELRETKVPFEIPTAELEKFISEITTGTKDEILYNIAYQFIPNKDDSRQLVLDIAKKHPLMSFAPHRLLDEKGRTIAVVGTVDKDLEGNVILQIANGFQLTCHFLRGVFNEAYTKNDIKKDDIITFLKNTPLIEPDRMSIIEAGIEAYFTGNYLCAIHLLIPQIENAMRNLVGFSGGNIYKPAKNGGFNLKTFDDILRDEIVLNVLGEDCSTYFRILFTDQRGWNLRNDVCHGLSNPNRFNLMVADRLIHSLLIIGTIRKEEVDDETTK